MDQPFPTGPGPSRELPGPQAPAALPPPLVTQEYRGNQYDVYSLIAGTLGGATLALCATGNLLLYCLPIAPLVLGIVALRRASSSVDPQRTRNLAWLGIAGGGLGTLLILCMLLFFLAYLAVIFAVFAPGLGNTPR